MLFLLDFQICFVEHFFQTTNMDVVYKPTKYRVTNLPATV